MAVSNYVGAFIRVAPLIGIIQYVHVIKCNIQCLDFLFSLFRLKNLLYGTTVMAADGVTINRKCSLVLTKWRHKKYWYVIIDYDIFFDWSVTVFFSVSLTCPTFLMGTSSYKSNSLDIYQSLLLCLQVTCHRLYWSYFGP